MPTYVITEIEWKDQEKAKEYREKFGPALEKYGGRTLVAAPPQVLEGSWKPQRVVILEFPTTEAMRAWYGSPEYAPVMRLRMEGATTNMISVERPAA
jgi:uncharacterized protein (DUF1330 family)